MDRIFIIGPFPPPLGGVSVHVARLTQLVASFGEVTVIDPYGIPGTGDQDTVVRLGPVGRAGVFRLLRAVSLIRDSVVHFHLSGGARFFSLSWLLFAVLDKSNAVVMSVHSGSFPEIWNRAGYMTKSLIKIALKRADAIVAVSKQIEKVIISGVGRRSSLVVLPAYIPEFGLKFANKLSVAESSNSKEFKLVSSGYGIELYGFHEIVSAIASSVELRSNCRLSLFIYNTWDEDYLARTKEHAAGVSLELFFDKTPEEFSEALTSSDIYIRATSKDGDSVAVREALGIGVSVICSDVSDRPDGCTIYAKGDRAALSQSILDIIQPGRSTPCRAKQRIDTEDEEAYRDKYRKVYRVAMANRDLRMGH